MYEIKSIEFGRKTDKNNQTSLSSKNYFDHYQQISSDSADSSISTIQVPIVVTTTTPDSHHLHHNRHQSASELESDEDTMQVSLRRRRIFQRQACLLSILAAFILGLMLGVFMPMMSGMSGVFITGELIGVEPVASSSSAVVNKSVLPLHPPSDFPTIYELRGQPTPKPPAAENLFSVSFIKEKELPAEEVFRNAFHLEQDKHSEDSMIVKKLDAIDGSIKEFRVQRTSDGLFRKGPERRLSKPSVVEQMLPGDTAQLNLNEASISFMPIAEQIVRNANHNTGIVESDIYWGSLVEHSLPKGFLKSDAAAWNNFIHNGVVTRLETGCGRMQNRLVVFADGTRACARYRQNTDQIQGELFSFYLGQLLNLTNLAPSAASVIDLESATWANALQDITNAQWKSTRPVVLTKWLPDLEPAGIPQPFQPLERHLNKYDVWNITLGTSTTTTTTFPSSTSPSSTSSPSSSIADDQDANQKGLLKRLGAAAPASSSSSSSTINSANNNNNNNKNNHNRSSRLNQSKSVAAAAATSDSSSLPASSSSSSLLVDRDELHLNATVLNRLIELAQWSDLIVFDYLIANLDRVVNNLYNYQWNADIMAAPAHNLARQINSQLLVFLDNESGLLHGYRLLKKYEAYHGLLLDNLCIFRRPTIEALRNLREYGPGKRLQELFELSTSYQVRDVLPSLPDKSIKILIDRIDRVLGQVQKCRDLFSDR
ncbi:extracellular serine/threonine protein kinase four-jointed [Episyrphus balteatus]|uniref:extracellular serine/threonine protein kinase four-jointed n=1 Tax=Episyrphus balteatus TaxID=286459 RepID=UPI0024857A82|nr:extracellular serine/threonine protein kinase four-jointed [Episyrphus balteatus]